MVLDESGNITRMNFKGELDERRELDERQEHHKNYYEGDLDEGQEHYKN